MQRSIRFGASVVVPLLLCVGTTTVQAAVVVGWDFDPLPGGLNSYGPSPYAPTETMASVAVGGLTRGSGIATGGTGAADGWGGQGFTTASPSFAAAVAADELASLTLTLTMPASTISFESIGVYNIRHSGSGPSTGQWQYQIGAGAWTDIGSAITWGTTTTAAGNPQSAIDLTSIPSLQNIGTGTVVGFRIVTWGATSSAGTWYFNDASGAPGSDLTITASISAVPEASSFIFGGLICAALGLQFGGRRFLVRYAS